MSYLDTLYCESIIGICIIIIMVLIEANNDGSVQERHNSSALGKECVFLALTHIYCLHWSDSGPCNPLLSFAGCLEGSIITSVSIDKSEIL